MAAGNIARQIYTVRVQPPNRPPVIDSAAVLSATAGLVYRYDVRASDPDGNTLSYALSTAGSGYAWTSPVYQLLGPSPTGPQGALPGPDARAVNSTTAPAGSNSAASTATMASTASSGSVACAFVSGDCQLR